MPVADDLHNLALLDGQAGPNSSLANPYGNLEWVLTGWFHGLDWLVATDQTMNRAACTGVSLSKPGSLAQPV